MDALTISPKPVNARPVGNLLQWMPVAALSLVLALAPSFLSDFSVNLLGRFLTYAIVALGLNLLWGYCGMLSMGQGLFFGLGAYAMGMYLKLEGSGKELPDFMSWSGLDRLPAFWEPFRSPVFAIVAAILVPALIAILIGLPIFRSRTRDVYFSIITQAFTLIVSILFVGQQAYSGGTNGITDLGSAKIFGKALLSPEMQRDFYFTTVVCLAAVYLLARWLTESRFGRLLVALRDNEDRVRFLGYDPVMLKVLIFAFSAFLAALAGILFVPQVGIISPSSMGVVPSIEMVIWVALGGRGTLVGAIAGARCIAFTCGLPANSNE